MTSDGPARWLTLWSDSRRKNEPVILGWLDGLRRLGFEGRTRERGADDSWLVMLQVRMLGGSLEHELRQIQQTAAAIDEDWAADVDVLVRRLWPRVTLWSGPRKRADEVSAGIPKGVDWLVAVHNVDTILVSWRHFDRARSALICDSSAHEKVEWLTPYANSGTTWPRADQIAAVAAGLASRGLRTRVTTTGSAEAQMPVLLVGSDGEDLEQFVARVSAATGGVEDEWATEVAGWVEGLIPTVMVHCASVAECHWLLGEIRRREPELRWGSRWNDRTDRGELYAGIADVERALETIDRTLGR